MIAVIGFAIAVGAPLLARVAQSAEAVGFILVGVVLAYLVALGLDGASVALSPLGPTQNSRFYGVSNLLETLLLVPALAGAALLTRRFGWPAFAGVALVTLLAVAGDRFGADGGGAIVLGVGLRGARRRARRRRPAGARAGPRRSRGARRDPRSRRRGDGRLEPRGPVRAGRPWLARGRSPRPRRPLVRARDGELVRGAGRLDRRRRARRLGRPAAALRGGSRRARRASRSRRGRVHVARRQRFAERDRGRRVDRIRRLPSGYTRAPCAASSRSSRS